MKSIFVMSVVLCFVQSCSYSRCSSPESDPDPVTDEEFVHVIPDNGDEPCSPYFFIKSNNPEKSWMPLASTRAYVEITGNIANVKVEQIYENKSKRKLDAIYIFPGSTRAAVYGLDMTIGKRVIHAKVKEREQARKEFEQARKDEKRATLLEQDRPNVFKMEVANIGPGEKVKVEMYYTELLEYRDKEYEFVYPMAVGPRYSTANEEYVQRSIEQLMSKHRPKFDVDVIIDGAIPVQSVVSPSHQLKMNRATENATVVVMHKSLDESEDKDFILRYGLQGEEVMGGLTLYEHHDEKFFLLTMQPPKKSKESMVMPREYIFIVDVSGSMYGYPLEVSKSILRKLISSLKPADRFNVLLFESSQAMLSDVSLPATADNIKKAIKVIDRHNAGGGTELYSALETAFRYKDPALDKYARTFIIATDGFVSVESKVFQLIRDNLHQASFVPLGVGNGVNRYLIEGMAWAGASEPFIIANETEAEKVGERLIQTISKPLYSHIQIDWGDFQAYDVYPKTIPDVFTDRPIFVFGKYKGDAKGAVEMKGETVMGEFKIRFPVSSATRTKNQALRYLWARNTIKYLCDYASLFDKDVKYYYHTKEGNKYKQEIIDLGLKYNLLTAYTSFLAVDEEKKEAEVDMQFIAHFSPPPLIEMSDANSEADISIEPLMQAISIKEDENQVLDFAESMPNFPGGIEAMKEYIARQLKYPELEAENGVEGRVVLRFKVTATGEITDIEVLRSVSDECDKEAIRLVKMMPRWIPGKQGGKAVAVYYVLPVRFSLKDR